MDTSFYLTLMDEIALEGLQGITFESLWIRLEERDRYHFRVGKSPLFCSFKPNELHETVFKICTKEIVRGNLKCHRLPSARPKISIYDRNEFFVLETGTIVHDDAQIPDNLNPIIAPVCDTLIKGSAADFQDRIDISEEVENVKDYSDFKKQFPVDQVILVASQKLRSIALFGFDRWQEWSEMKLENYVMLESVGYKRWYGEINLGKEAPKYAEDRYKAPGFYQYTRRNLKENHLIVCSNHSVYTKHRQQIFASTIAWLVRFRPLIQNQNDPKILEMVSLFRNTKRNKIPLMEFKEILKPIDFKRKIRDFLSRYSFFKIIREETFMVEYLRPLDQPLDYDDLHFTAESAEQEDQKQNDEQNEDDEEPDESLMIQEEPVDSDEEKVIEETSEADSNLEIAWNSIDSFQATENENINSNQIVGVFKSSSKISKDQLNDPKLINRLKITLPKWKLIKTHDDQALKIMTHKLQQFPLHIRERFFWLLCQTCPVSRGQLIHFLNLPSVTLRGFIKYFESTGGISHIKERFGRQLIYKYIVPKPIANSMTVSVASDRRKMRIQLMLEFFYQTPFVDSLHHLKNFICSKETDLSWFIDVGSIKRILNQMKDEGHINLFHYCFYYSNTHFRNKLFVIRHDANQEIILEHLKMKTLFFWFGRYPVDLEHDIKIKSILDKEGNLMMKPKMDDFKRDRNDTLDALIEPGFNLFPVGKLTSERHYPSRLERIFEMYKLLHHFFVENYESIDNFATDDWRRYVPKLTGITIDRQFRITDIMPYIPLVKLRDLVPIRNMAPGLAQLMDSSFRSNHKLTLYKLPAKIRSQLLYDRKVIQDIQELLTSLSYFSLVTLVEGDLTNSSQKNRLVYRFNTRVKVDGLPEYDFENLDLFEKFIEMVYSHTIDGTQCEQCPFDARLNIHTIRINNLVKRQLTKENRLLKRNMKRKRIRTDSEVVIKKVKSETIKEKNDSVEPLVKKRRKPMPQLVEKNKRKEPKKSRIILRSKFTRSEDNFLLKCHLASWFVEQGQNSSFRIPGHVLCDGIKPYSKSKKSIASYRRRIRFLLKKNPIKLLIKSCIYELKASKLFLAQANSEDQNQSLPLSVRKVSKFKRILQKITEFEFMNNEHFQTNRVHRNSEWEIQNQTEEPENLETFLSQYDIINLHNEDSKDYFCEPKNYYDIHSYVITNVLLSSLILIRLHQGRDLQDKEKVLRRSYMRNVFKALKHFPKTLIKLVLKRLTQFRFISHNRRKDPNDKWLLSYAYKLGENFLRLLSPHHISMALKFHHSLDGEKCRTELEDNNTVISAMEFAENLCVNVLGLAQPNLSESRTDKPPKKELYPPTLLEDLRYQIDIPENFIRLSKDLIKVANQPPWNHTRRISNRGALIDRDIKVNITGGKPADRPVITQLSLIDDMSVIHCKVRMHQTAPIQESSQTITQLLKIHLQTFGPKEFDNEYSDSQLQNNYDLFQEYQEKIVSNLGTEMKLLDLIESVKQKKELGITMDELINRLQCRNTEFETVYASIDDFMYTCQRNKIIFSVGIVQRTFVHRDFVNFWMVHSFKNLDIDAEHLLALEKSSMKKIQKIYFLPKLWRSPDGHLNTEVLFLFLNRLVGFLVQESGNGCDLATLWRLFHKVLPKVQMEELLKMLETIGCVQRIITVEPDAKGRTTLEEFLSPTRIDQPESPDIEPSSSPPPLSRKRKFFYEATIDSYSRLASFYHNVIKEFEQ